MSSPITTFRSWSLKGLEDSFSPLPRHSNQYRVFHHSRSIVYIPLSVVAVGMGIIETIFSYATSFLFKKNRSDPLSDFTAITEDSRNWERIKNTDVRFDPSFFFGAATCTYQDSGEVHCPDSQWKGWEEKQVPKDNRSGRSADLFTLYQTKKGRATLIDRLHKLGLNSYRFSIEWSHIQPQQGVFIQENLAIYVALCKALRDAGISPMVTLHHFSEPEWFHQLGSFENPENMRFFIQFCEEVFPALTQRYENKPLVEYICTINEPNIEALSRYVLGSFSPGYKIRFAKAGQFLHNALKAHCAVYDLLKKMNPHVKIGIVHQRLSMIPTNLLVAPVTHYLNRLVNETVLHFFKTKTFQFKIPFCCHLYDQTLTPKADFVGLQYYTRPVIGLLGSTSYHEPMTLMPFREDPEGLYKAILEVYDAFKIPVIITENGISTNDETQRGRYMQRALYATYRALEKIGKENLLGYYVWSFCENSEWERGRNPQRFGVYALDHKGNLTEEPKEGITPFIRTAKASKIR